MSHATITTTSKTVPNHLAPLFQPIQLGALKLKNRVLFGPMTRNRGNVPTEMQARYYAQRAGAGLIISESTAATPQGYEFSNAPGIYSEKQISGWRVVTDAVHAAGGLILNQINDIGRVAHPLLQSGQPALAPSAVGAQGGSFKQLNQYSWADPAGKIYDFPAHTGYATPEAIDDPATHVAQYRRAFENAKLAGFDGVEIHGANGYLVHQFLDSKSNQRNDEWGGTPEKRSKFALEVVKQAITVWGADRVGIKLSPEGGYNDMGMPLDETLATFGYLLSELSSLSIAYVAIQRWFPAFDPDHRGTEVPNATWRKLYSGNLLLGGTLSAQNAAETIRAGHADAAVFGRDWLANPDLIQRLQQGLPLNAFQWATAYTTGERGYTDYPKWDNMSQQDQQQAIKQQQQN